MARVALVLHPAGHIAESLRLVRPGHRGLKGFLFVFEGMAVGWEEIGMHSLVRYVEKPGLAIVSSFALRINPRSQPFEGIVRELVRDVALLSHPRSIHIETGSICLWDVAPLDLQALVERPVNPLPLEAHPVIKAPLFLIGVPHVPLPDKSRFVARLLEKFREKHQVVPDRVVVVHNPVVVCIAPGDD